MPHIVSLAVINQVAHDGVTKEYNPLPLPVQMLSYAARLHSM